MKRTVVVLALAAATTLVVCGAAWAAVVAFAPAKNYRAGDVPYGISAGDLDSDGDTDLVTSNRATDSVSVLLRRKNGTFGAPRKFAVGDDPLEVIVREDFDGDGKRDLASVNFGSDDVSVRLGRGDGTFLAQRRYAVGNNRPVSIESGDFDRDGDKDLVTAVQGEPNGLATVSVFENRGDGTFQAARNYLAGEYGGPSDIDRSDLDGDGDEDLVVALAATEADDGGLGVLMNDGTGAFGALQKYYGITFAYAVLAVDLDGDGDSDLAAAGNNSTDSVSVFENGGDGTFAFQGEYPIDPDPAPGPQDAEQPGAITEADFDRDGDIDVATANFGSFWDGGPDNVTVLTNTGDGTLVANPETFGAGTAPGAISRVRMNGDRKPDLVVSNSGSDDVSVLINTTQ